jgi:glycerol-1-phosphate dehydrogenase [NAD(P)+]
VAAVRSFFFQDFLANFDAQGRCPCRCGQIHAIGARLVLVAVGALESGAAALVQQYGKGARLWILSDENTEAAAGSRWKSAVHGARISAKVLSGRSKTVPTAALVEQLAGEVRAQSPDVLVAVGSGVISDLVKRVSLDTGRPNWCVATAASVDAYSSATAAIQIDGFHNALPARASEAIVCDLDVIAGAPREMFLAGLGDLLAKLIAHTDWNLSRIMTGEHYCPLVASVALESARSALSAARALRFDHAEAVRTLTDAALCSGFAMQAFGSSRSAASAEHMMAHFWETAHCVGNIRFDLHGILAGAASRIVLNVYRSLYEHLASVEPDVQRRLDSYDGEPPWQGTVEEGLLPFMGKVRAEMSGRRFDRGILAQRLEAFRIGRVEIVRLGQTMLDELGAAIALLEGIGYPFSMEELAIPVDLMLLPLRNVRMLRRRYSGFDLAYELGLESIMRRSGEEYAAGVV